MSDVLPVASITELYQVIQFVLRRAPVFLDQRQSEDQENLLASLRSLQSGQITRAQWDLLRPFLSFDHARHHLPPRFRQLDFQQVASQYLLQQETAISYAPPVIREGRPTFGKTP